MSMHGPQDRSAPIRLANASINRESTVGARFIGAPPQAARRKESAELQEAAWTRRFTALGRRLDEAVELYHQLGFEVLLKPADPDEQASTGAESCKRCFVTAYARTIYTRPCTTDRLGEPSPAPVSDSIGA